MIEVLTRLVSAIEAERLRAETVLDETAEDSLREANTSWYDGYAQGLLFARIVANVLKGELEYDEIKAERDGVFD